MIFQSTFQGLMFCLNSGDNEVFPMSKRRQTIMKYKVGDKVRVRSDLVIRKYYGSRYFTIEMDKLSSNIVTITEVFTNRYYIKEDCGRFGWTDEMFEDIKEDKMDNNTLQINMNNLTDEERATLLPLVEKANKPKNKVWKPEEGEKFYTLYGDGSIYELTWFNNADRIKIYEIGNCFKTKDEAEFALERQKVITELKRFALEHNEEIDGNNKQQNKYILFYNLCGNSIGIDYWSSRYYGISFTSKEIAWQAVEKIGKERLKKYYFEVKE